MSSNLFKIFEMVNKISKSSYTTVLSQAFSPCGNYVVVGDIYGDISVFHLSKIVQAETDLTKEELSAKNKFTVEQDCQVNSLLTVKNFLLAGGLGEIHAYHWKAVKSNKNVKPAWSITIPDQKDTFERADINSLARNEDSNSIFVGCGDNNIYEFDLETRNLLKSLKIHSDYIHTIKLFNNDLISGGEDGIINISDIRSYKVSNKIKPYLQDKIARPDLGIWIGDIDCNEDYILCGGGPRLSLWSYRFLRNSNVFPITDQGIHVAEIYEDKILAGGRSDLFYQMSYSGEIITEIQVSPVTIYSSIHQSEPFQAHLIAGSSSKIDVCSNFMYKNQQLYL